MANQQVRPNNTTFVSVALSLGRAGRPLECVDLLASMREKGTPPDAVCYQAVLRVLDRWDRAEEASALFEEMMTRQRVALVPGGFVAFVHLSRLVLSGRVLSYLVFSCLCLVLSCLVLSSHVLSCLIFILSCLVLSCLLMSSHVLSCLVLSRPVFLVYVSVCPPLFVE